MNAGFRVARRTVCVLVVAVTTVLVPTATSQAASVRVPEDYFGVNFQYGDELTPTARELHLDAIAAAGLSQVRIDIAWRTVEPTAPANGTHFYNWQTADDRIAAAARHGITVQPTLVKTPAWAAPTGPIFNLKCKNAPVSKPVTLAPFFDFARAVSQRYGRGGTFWSQHPELPPRPLLRYEIWNEANLVGGWCPTPEPERYADLFIGAATAIRAVDPNAEIVLGGLAPPKNPTSSTLSVSTFLRRATNHRAQLEDHVSSLAIHMYPGVTASNQTSRVSWFREELRAGGIGDEIPMSINEIGWATLGDNPVPESMRVQAYAGATIAVPRTNCNVDGLLAHAWITPERNRDSRFHWLGIANPATAVPYPSGAMFSDGLRFMRGELAYEPPTATIIACPGMPLPDSDGDGALDSADYYPHDPAQS